MIQLQIRTPLITCENPDILMTATDTFQTTSNFGLIERSYDTDAEFDPDHERTQWQLFEQQVSQLNRDSGKGVQYKVLYSE